MFGLGLLWVLAWAFFVFCEACPPLPVGEGPGERAGFGGVFFVSGEGFAGWMEQKKGGAYRAYGPDSTAQAARIAVAIGRFQSPYCRRQ